MYAHNSRFKHGLAAIQKRREESITTEHEEGVKQQMLDGLIADKGGDQQVSTATRILAEVIASDAAWLMVFNGAINHIIQNNPKARQNPRGLSQLRRPASLTVHIRVGLDDDGRAILGGGSTIQTFYTPDKQRTMNGDQWFFKDRGSVVGGPAMRDDVPVIDSKEFKAFQGDVYTVNSTQFQASIMKMYPAYTRMGVIKLKG